MVHDAVTESINSIDPSKVDGFSLGDKVKYRMICQYVEQGKTQRTAYHEAIVTGFTKKSIKISFPNGYSKYARADQLEKI